MWECEAWGILHRMFTVKHSATVDTSSLHGALGIKKRYLFVICMQCGGSMRSTVASQRVGSWFESQLKQEGFLRRVSHVLHVLLWISPTIQRHAALVILNCVSVFVSSPTRDKRIGE